MTPKHLTFQTMKVDGNLYTAFLDGKDIVLHAWYRNMNEQEIRISGSRLTRLLELEKESNHPHLS